MATLKNTTINDVGSLTLPAGSTGQRPGSPQAGMVRYNTDIDDTEFYDGDNWRPINDTNPEATGGTIIDVDIGGIPYRIHKFTNTGNSTFTVTKGGEVEYLIVGGGGSGGSRHAGGGGGGGVVQGFTTVTPQAYTITVGGGGTAVFTTGQAIYYNGDNGDNSSAFGLTALGGGGGGRGGSSGQRGLDGGSGGGAGENTSSSTGGSATQPSSASGGLGNAGGNANTSGSWNGSGGGGGAGSPGQNGQFRADPSGGDGGNGFYSTITGIGEYYAGGGGGSVYGNTTSTSVTVKNHGRGGLGGGGAGGTSDGFPGAPNTGGGGGGGSSNGDATGRGGDGGSGVVIIRYRKNTSTTTSPTRRDKSLVPQSRAEQGGGLVVHFDAARPESYIGSGTTVVNLINSELVSEQGPNGTLRGTWSFNTENNGKNNYWRLNADAWINTNIDIRNTDWSLSIWCRFYNGVDGARFFGAGPPAVNTGMHILYSGTQEGFQRGRFGLYGNDRDWLHTPNTTDWYHYVFTKNNLNPSKKIYANGKNLNDINQTVSISGPAAWTGAPPLRIGQAYYEAQGTGGPGIDVGWVKVYKKVLTDEEVLNDYYTLRRRLDS